MECSWGQPYIKAYLRLVHLGLGLSLSLCPELSLSPFSYLPHPMTRSLKPKSSVRWSRYILFFALISSASLLYRHYIHHAGDLEAFPSHGDLREFYAAHAPPPIEHPIPELMREAEAKFNKMLASQSTTLSEAVKKYKARYGRNPPLGFDDWFKFATDNGATIIDEYDQLINDLRPFWLLKGEEIRRRSVQVGLLPSVDLVRIQGGKTKTIDVNTGFDDAEVGARAKGFRVMLEKFQCEAFC